ncbi:MAG TPA: redox-sensing transcriptional repressor Rex [Bacteroidetes bacterium]|nr:redox-sensing transcriptional repressor Rex [Bacteroidota bacterium]
MQRISDSTVHRLSKYFRTLIYMQGKGIKTVSSKNLAHHNGVTAAQVRKDLSCFGAFGRRGLGYNVVDLRSNIGKIMGLDRAWKVALCGVGNIGRALLDYDQFRSQGFQITVAFDKDPAKIGKTIHGVSVRNEIDLERDVKAEKVDIAVVAVPARAAQSIVDRLVVGGVKAILNFAPINIKVPPGVYIRHENMAIEIETLSFALTNPDLVQSE